MSDLTLNKSVIDNVCSEIVNHLQTVMNEDLLQIILYGSCARGDYSPDSDIDIAIILKCDRLTSKKYSTLLVAEATELAMKYYSIVNFVCLPLDEFEKNSSWYPYFHNIQKEGIVLYHA